MNLLRIAIIGAGRMGQGVGNALAGQGQSVTLLGRRAQDVGPPFSLADAWAPTLRAAHTVLIATPDAAVESVAAEVSELGVVTPQHVVLHLAGPLDRAALGALHSTGAALGSFHPLQTVADPASATERLIGAYAGLEGDDRAIEMGKRLAKLLQMVPIIIPPGGKAKYHAGAVMAANYIVGLFGAAQRLATEAGIDAGVAGRMYTPLLQGVVDNIVGLGPAEALTGPIRRGDLTTIRLHLSALSVRDQELYRALGLATLTLARAAGLAEERAQQVQVLLEAERNTPA